MFWPENQKGRFMQSRDQQLKEIVLESAALLAQQNDSIILSFDVLSEACGIEVREIRKMFPDLFDLVKTLLDRMHDTFLVSIEEEIGQDEAPGAFTRAFVRHARRDVEERHFSAIAGMMLKSVQYCPELISPIRLRQKELMCLLEKDGLHPMKSHTVRLALDGLWMNMMFEMEPLRSSDVMKFFDWLEDFCQAPCEDIIVLDNVRNS